MITFIDDHRGDHGIEPICKVLQVAPSTYHDHVAKRRDPSRLSVRAKMDVALKPEIALVFNRTSRSMACARCGGSSGVKARQLPVARWRD